MNISVNTLRITASLEIPLSELRFRTSRSGGPGGQNVNKVETRVELLFDVMRSPSLSDEQRRMILDRCSKKVDSEGMLRITAQQSRSQWENKQNAISRLAEVLWNALRPRKKRVNTVPTAGSRRRRSRSKKKRSETKQLRIKRIAHDE